MKVRFVSAARGDLRAGVPHHEAQRRGLGAEFRDEVRATIARIEALPEA